MPNIINALRITNAWNYFLCEVIMMKTKALLSGLFFAILVAGNANSVDVENSALFISQFQKSENEYQLAKSTFLPDADGDLGLSGHSISKYDHNYGDNCAGYNLEACPDGGICASCPFNLTKKKLVSCKSGFEKSGSSCVASSCGAINSSYKDSIPTNQICTKFTEGGKTCYKDCKAVDCSGYPLTNCTTTVANSTGLTICPNCESANANCSPKKCKITACNTGYKLNAAGTACVEKDDTCPTGYYKTCETGTIGDPVQTEKGTNCYQCKPLDDNCPSGYTKQSCVNGYSATATTEAGSTCYLCNATDRPCDECDEGEVCLYETYDSGIGDYLKNENGVYRMEYCVGPKCPEDLYPYWTTCLKPGCMLAPKHNKWAATRSCSYETCIEGDENCTLRNTYCDDFMYCNDNTEYYEDYSCTYYETIENIEDRYIAGFTITGDYSEYECPEYFTCVDNHDYYSSSCEIAGDFNESLKTLVNAACPNISSGADARLVVFYKDENNDDVYYLKSELNEQSNIHNSTCYNPEYGNCPLKTVLTGWADNDSEWQSCNLWNYYWSDDKQEYDQSGYLMNRQKKYIYSEGVVEFCQMKYCAIQLYDQASDTASAYGVDEEVATIVNTVVGPNISETNPFYIYLWRVDSINDYYNGTGVFEPNTKYRSCDAENDPECRTFAISTYLNKPGGCVGYTIDNYGSQTETRIITSDATSTVGTNKLMYIYRFFYNPNTLEAHRNNTIVSKTVDTNNDCYHRLIKGKTFCNHQSTYMYSCDGCGSDRATIKPPVGFSC